MTDKKELPIEEPKELKRFTLVLDEADIKDLNACLDVTTRTQGIKVAPRLLQLAQKLATAEEFGTPDGGKEK